MDTPDTSTGHSPVKIPWSQQISTKKWKFQPRQLSHLDILPEHFPMKKSPLPENFLQTIPTQQSPHMPTACFSSANSIVCLCVNPGGTNQPLYVETCNHVWIVLMNSDHKAKVRYV